MLASGTLDLPGWSVMTRTAKNPSLVGACYSCEQRGGPVYGSKSINGGELWSMRLHVIQL